MYHKNMYQIQRSETTARGGYDRTTASSEENTVANQEAVEENQVETEEEQGRRKHSKCKF